MNQWVHSFLTQRCVTRPRCVERWSMYQFIDEQNGHSSANDIFKWFFFCILIKISLKFFSQGFNWQSVSIRSGDGLTPPILKTSDKARRCIIVLTPTFCRQHFQINFVARQYFILLIHSLNVVLNGLFNNKSRSIDLGNGNNSISKPVATRIKIKIR